MSCLSWGLMLRSGICRDCHNFEFENKEIGDCASCDRPLHVRRGYCRLCWCQGIMARPIGSDALIFPFVEASTHQQLFFASMNRRKAAPRAFPRRAGILGPRPRPTPPVVTGPLVDSIQPSLFAKPITPIYRWDRVDMRRTPLDTLNPWMPWALHLANVMAAVRGFRYDTLHRLNHGLAVVLADYRGGESIRVSDFANLLVANGIGLNHTCDVLDSMGILTDDRTPPFYDWLNGRTKVLAPAIGDAVNRWARHLYDGVAHPLPCSSTAHTYTNSAHPALVDWSLRYDALK